MGRAADRRKTSGFKNQSLWRTRAPKSILGMGKAAPSWRCQEPVVFQPHLINGAEPAPRFAFLCQCGPARAVYWLLLPLLQEGVSSG